MGKSVGNSITIKNALKDISSRQLRILFLLHNYNDPLDYSLGMIEQAKNIDSIIANFIALIDASLRNYKSVYFVSDSGSADFITSNYEHLATLANLKLNVDKALRNNIDTKQVMIMLIDFLGLTNKLVTVGNVNPNVISESINYVLSVLTMFGVDYAMAKNSSDESKGNLEDMINLLVDTRVKLRDELRSVSKNKDGIKNMWSILDLIRANMLSLGVIVEDSGKNSTWRYDLK